MTYNHAMTLAFAVRRSAHADAQKCVKLEKHLVIAALLRRVAELVADPVEYGEALTDCFDSYEESDLPPILEI